MSWFLRQKASKGFKAFRIVSDGSAGGICGRWKCRLSSAPSWPRIESRSVELRSYRAEDHT